MFSTRRYSVLLSMVLAIMSGCATQQAKTEAVAAADSCSWMHASYKIEGRSGSADFAVGKDAEVWIPLTSDRSLTNPEVSAFFHADGKLEVSMRTDKPGGGKDRHIIWLGPAISDGQVRMYGQITRPRPHFEPGGWPEYDLFPGVDVIGLVYVSCRASPARGMPPAWDSYAA